MPKLKVNALVQYMEDHDPSGLQRLRQRYPHEIALVDQDLGPDKGITEGDVQLTAEALKAMRERTAPNINRLRIRLAQAKFLRTVGNWVTLFSSAGLITAVMLQQRGAAVATAIINFVASGCSLSANHLEGSLYGGKDTLVDTFETLVSTSVKAEQIEAELDIAHRHLSDQEQIQGLIQQANELAADLRKIELLLWGPVIRETRA
jgi:hypothetical protein